MLYIVTHEHKHGTSVYLMRCEKMKLKLTDKIISAVVNLFGIDYEPEKLESIAVEPIDQKEIKILTLK